MDGGILSAIIVAIAVVIGAGAYYVTKTPDSIAEEVAEHVIKVNTGVDVDISPSTPE